MENTVIKSSKDVAFYFFDLFNITPDRGTIAKTVNMVNILAKKHPLNDIVTAVDYVKYKLKINNIYSFGYIYKTIDDVLLKIETNNEKATLKEFVSSSLSDLYDKEKDKVVIDNDSTQRNIAKADRFGIQSGFGKKFNFDMFKEHG